jgi:hypothetical protein
MSDAGSYGGGPGSSYYYGGDGGGGDASASGDYGGGSDTTGVGYGSYLGYAGAAASMLGGILGASGAQQAAAAQAKGYRENAAVQGQNAAQARFATIVQQQHADYLANRTFGAQRAAEGAAGVNPNTGSPLDVMADTADQVKFEALSRWYSGQYAAERAGTQYDYDIQAARAAKQAGDTSAIGSLVNGIGGGLIKLAML